MLIVEALSSALDDALCPATNGAAGFEMSTAVSTPE